MKMSFDGKPHGRQIMRCFDLPILAAVLLLPLLASAPANAQATRTWVSGVGDDANPCSRTAPCKTFAGAISKTAPAGEINCLDPGGFGAVTVTKSMTISCEAGTAGVLVAGTNGIVFAGGVNDYLFLKGLDIEGVGSGLNGILFNSGAFLHVEDTVIRHFIGSGILIQPNQTAGFEILRTTTFDNGNGTTGSGVRVFPSSGTTSGVIDRVVADRNTFGIAADGTGGAAAVMVDIRDSTAQKSNQAGIIAATTAAPTSVMVTRTSSSYNTIGLQTSGAGATMRVGESVVTGNGTGVSGTVFSYVTNQLNGNTTDGTLTAISPGPLH
jgi:hypothetical protein